MRRFHITVVLLILLALFIWWAKQISYQSKHRAAFTSEENNSATNVASDFNSPKSANRPQAGGAAKTTEEKRGKYIEQARKYGMSLNRPANFYGQILDQNDQPVVGVKINGEISYFGFNVLPGLMPSSKKFERISDNDGRFSVLNETGLAMDLRLTSVEDIKFRPPALQVTFRDIAAGKSAPVLSTSEKPYIFHAFKKGLAETLIKGAMTFYDCIPDGRFYIINLKQARISEKESNGELKISIRRPIGTMGQEDFDWSVQIEGINAEIMQSHDVFMYHAPADGYISSWSFNQRAGVRNYVREVNSKFYIKSRDGLSYGRVDFMIISDYRDKSAIIINYALNPSGSQNLQ